MIKWQHESRLDKRSAQQFSENLTKRGLDHYTSAVDESGYITVMWSDKNPFDKEDEPKKK